MGASVNEESKQWSTRLRGPYETRDGLRFVVALHRGEHSVLCPMCHARIYPGSVVAKVADETLCMNCRPPDGSRVRAGMRTNRLRLRFQGFAMEGQVSLWNAGRGLVWTYPHGAGPAEHTTHKSRETNGRLLRLPTGWNGVVVMRRTVGDVDLLVPIKLKDAPALTALPSEAYLREATNNLLVHRMHDPEDYRRLQLASRMRLRAWNKGGAGT